MDGRETMVSVLRSLRGKSVFLLCFLILPSAVQSQIGPGSQGDTAVYNHSGSIEGSVAFVDASTFPGTDLCNTLYLILSSRMYPNAGTVIDARGITSSAALNCKSGTPWIQNDSSPTHNPPTSSTANILLPAGTITIYTSWVLPNYTRIIGEGTRTVISAGQGFAPPGWDSNSGGTGMIELGAFATTNAWENFPAPGPFPCINNAAPCICPIARNGPGCAGIGVQDLVLDGTQLAGTSVNGIYNASSQEMTYVDHVTMTNIEGIGLRISGATSGGSGPYSNIVFNAGTNAKSGTIANGGTACVDIQTLIRGIHGITCTAAGLGGSPAAAIYVDGGTTAVTNDQGGNTIEDVHVDGFQDGILIGSQNAAPGYILTNINGSNANHATDVKNVVHFCGSPAVGACPSTPFQVFNLTLNGITSAAAGVNTIEDDRMQTTLADSSVGMYILGVPFMNGTTVVGYGRFTTSPKVATWGVGTGAVSGTCPHTANGSLFSKTNGVPGSTLYVCAPVSPSINPNTSAWRAIK
jgi:hypothetical protein